MLNVQGRRQIQSAVLKLYDTPSSLHPAQGLELGAPAEPCSGYKKGVYS